jgi:hypothetical protein
MVIRRKTRATIATIHLAAIPLIYLTEQIATICAIASEKAALEKFGLKVKTVRQPS